jgi:hypothetical protein
VKPESGVAVMDPIAPICNLGCPREKGRACAVWVKPAPNAEWENHGTREAPTLTPSYNCVGGCGWHGYIVDGKMVDAPAGGISTMHVCANCKHPEIQTVHVGVKPLPDGRVGVDVKMSKTVVREPASSRSGGNAP